MANGCEFKWDVFNFCGKKLYLKEKPILKLKSLIPFFLPLTYKNTLFLKKKQQKQL